MDEMTGIKVEPPVPGTKADVNHYQSMSIWIPNPFDSTVQQLPSS